MKHIALSVAAIAALIVTPALAADMPLKAPPPPPAWNWTGCYIGGNGGGGWGTDGAWTDTIGLSHGGQSFSGGIGGGQVGCDYQGGSNWLIGVAGMFDWSSLTGSAIDPFNTTFTAHSKVTMFDTVTARAGITFGQALVYVDGGAAWSTTQRFFTPGGVACAIGVNCVTATNTATGWTVGGGLEYLLTPYLSAKIEYDYAAFGSVTFNPAIGGANTPYTVKQNINVVVGGLNYRFGLFH